MMSLLVQPFSNEESTSILPVPVTPGFFECRFHGIDRLARHARPCAGHPRPCSITARKAWMAGTSPAMTEKGINFKLLAEAPKCWMLFRSDSQDEVSVCGGKVRQMR